MPVLVAFDNRIYPVEPPATAVLSLPWAQAIGPIEIDVDIADLKRTLTLCRRGGFTGAAGVIEDQITEIIAALEQLYDEVPRIERSPIALRIGRLEALLSTSGASG